MAGSGQLRLTEASDEEQERLDTEHQGEHEEEHEECQEQGEEQLQGTQGQSPGQEGREGESSGRLWSIFVSNFRSRDLLTNTF